MTQCRFLPAILLLSIAAGAHAADKFNFDILTSKGVKTATCVVSTDKPKAGLKAHSVTTYLNADKGSRTIDYVFDKDGLMTSTGVSLSTDKSNMTYLPSKAKDKLVIAGIRNGAFVPAVTMDIANPDYAVTFPDDPGLWQIFLDSAAAHPHANHIYNLFLPATTPTGASRIEPLRMLAAEEAKGTLDGNPVVLKHYTLTFNKGATHLYTDESGKLMMADASHLGAKMIRPNFELVK